MKPLSSRTVTVATLGSAQTLAWASSYYLPAVLATPMARDLGVAAPTIFLAFSVALLMSALVGPWAGRAIDRLGGRPVLMGSNLLFALGLSLLSQAQGVKSLFAAWLLLGLAMGVGLYEAAFASLVRLYGHGARSAITGITLLAGFASTVGWPLSSVFEAHWGWRGACLVWAGLHLVLGLPLNRWLPSPAESDARAEGQVLPASAEPGSKAAAPSPQPGPPWGVSALLAASFALSLFIGTAMAAHLPRLLQAAGVSLAVAVAVGALIGPSQVAARVLEFGLLRRVHPLVSARIAAALHPLGAAALALFGAPAALAFALLHGAGNGILTITKGTVPLALFGPQGFGQRQGLLMVPARFSQALAPWLFGILLDRCAGNALWLSCALGLLAMGALLCLPSRQQTPSSP